MSFCRGLLSFIATITLNMMMMTSTSGQSLYACPCWSSVDAMYGVCACGTSYTGCGSPFAVTTTSGSSSADSSSSSSSSSVDTPTTTAVTCDGAESCYGDGDDDEAIVLCEEFAFYVEEETDDTYFCVTEQDTGDLIVYEQLESVEEWYSCLTMLDALYGLASCGGI